MNINVRDYGIEPGASVGKELRRLFDDVANMTEPTTIVFDKGIYYIDSEDAVYTHNLRVTNTIGIKEWRKGEDIQGKHIAMYMEGLRDVIIEGNGATIMLRGVMTNMALVSCENITIKDLIIDTEKPNLHRIKVTDTRALSFDFEIDKDSDYIRRGTKYYFVGKDYELSFTEKCRTSWWTGCLEADSPNRIVRGVHPLASAWHIKELSKGKFRAYSLVHPNIKNGNTYHIYDVRRKDVGIFIDRCKNVTLDAVTQHFNYSLGIVAQDTENISILGVKMKPSDTTELEMISIADFMHLCMCRGDIVVKDGEFIGAGDDCLNVHGIHYQIVNIEGDKIVVRYMHPQAYGFNPLRVGDTIEYVDRASLMPRGRANIVASRMVDEYNIELTLDSTENANTNYVIEDISACPNLTFEDNYMTRIITRGILITTRGEVVVKHNDFDSCSMHSILFSDDANSWYESGRVKGALIENNRFGYTPMYNVYIKPENKTHEDYVHGDFVIKNNKFESSPNGGIYAKSTRSVTLDGNDIRGDLRVDAHDVGAINR